jgi:hypothetical protein
MEGSVARRPLKRVSSSSSIAPLLPTRATYLRSPADTKERTWPMIPHLHAAAIMDSVRVPARRTTLLLPIPPITRPCQLPAKDLVQPPTPWRKFPT